MRKRLFDEVFIPALRAVAGVEEAGDRINLAIKLILPLAEFDRLDRLMPSGESGDRFNMTTRSYAVDTLELIERLELQAEKDYLTRLFLVESLPYGIFSDDEIERLVKKIEGEEERSAALLHWGLICAERPSKKALAEQISLSVEELGPYEKLLRAILLAPLEEDEVSDGGAQKEPDAELLERIESAAGRARVYAELAGSRAFRNRPERSAKYLENAENAVAEMTDPDEKDDALFFLFCHAAWIEFARIEPLAGGFADPLIALRGLKKYYLARFVEQVGPLQCDDPFEKKSVLAAVRRILAVNPSDLDRQVRLRLESAALFYAAGERDAARTSVREILVPLEKIENPAQKATLCQQLVATLFRAGERKAAGRILPILEKATDSVMPDDLAQLLWREHLLMWVRIGADETAESYLNKVVVPAERAVFKTALLLHSFNAEKSNFDADEKFSDILRSIAAEQDRLTRAAALVKICRLLALAPR